MQRRQGLWRPQKYQRGASLLGPLITRSHRPSGSRGPILEAGDKDPTESHVLIFCYVLSKGRGWSASPSFSKGIQLSRTSTLTASFKPNNSSKVASNTLTGPWISTDIWESRKHHPV